MIKLGVTGGIGSGKTTVSNIFALMDIPVYIADIQSKKITESSLIVRERLIKLFGENLYDGGQLNKTLLASHIFSSKEKLLQVNSIIHPEVEKDYKTWLYQHKDKKITVKEAAILFESGFDKFVNKTITVYTPLEERIERTMNRDNITRNEVLNRINSQMSDEEKKKLSDFVIINDNTQSLIAQVVSILKQLNVYEA